MVHTIDLCAAPRDPPAKTGGNDKAPKRAQAGKRFGQAGRLAIKAMVIFGAAAACWLWMLRPVYITGNGMFPALKDGDLCIVYRGGTCCTGNLVIYKAKDKSLRAGRVAASAGQEIDFPEGGGYTVNGYQPAEEITYPTYRGEDAAIEYPLTVPEDSFFLMNDFRSDDNDSRSCGCIAGEDIIGRVVFLFRRRGF